MKNKGFTLAELVVVLLMAGIAATILFPSMVGTYRRWAVRSAADEFITLHALTRSAATAYGRVAELHVDANSGRFWVEVDTGTAVAMRDTVGPIRSVKRWVQISIEPADRDVFCFDSRGVPVLGIPCDPSGATIAFVSGDRRVELLSTGLGKVLR